MNRAKFSFLWSLIACVALSFAADFTFSTLKGYTLRTDTAILLGLELASLGLASGAALFVLKLATRAASANRIVALLGTPWVLVFLAALSPLVAVRLWFGFSILKVAALPVLLAIVLFSDFLLRRLSLSSPGPLSSLTLAVATIALTLGLIQTHRHPTRAVIAPPRAETSGPATPENPNLLFVVLDTTRADRLSVYGHDKVVMPWLDRFAKEATVFDFAFSCSSYTLPSHASFFTGLYPRAHGAHVLRDHERKEGESVQVDWLGPMSLRPLSPEALTLAEIARAMNIETGAIAANAAYLAPEFNLGQGFDTYVSFPGPSFGQRPVGLSLAHKVGRTLRIPALGFPIDRNEVRYMIGSEVNRLVARWLPERADRRFFLFVNYMESHDPYWSVGTPGSLANGDPERGFNRYSVRAGESHLSEEDVRLVSEAYNREIDQLDIYLSELFAELEALDLMDKTLVLLAGDHGDSHGEHGQIFHPDSVYQPEVHVPLIIKRPGQTDAKRVTDMVHIVDIFPTLLDEMGWARPPGIQGTSLFSSDRDNRPFPIVAHLGPYRRELTEQAIIEDPWKLIRNSEGTIELYDLRNDPDELDDRAVAQPEIVADLLARLDRFEADVSFQFSETELNMSEETLQTLRDLGYIQ